LQKSAGISAGWRVIMEELGKLPATLFSPTKMIYIAYVVLLGMKILPSQSFLMFVGVSFAFWIAEIFHNDYLRIRLNRKAERN
jgi:hypothetical protein